jgi:diaminohydroxyphosphoribosylaminopyrimidine deaminase/5-amino-6-(5-phosphoribosylamino)uracil reductase
MNKRRYMRMAIELAKRGQGKVYPNPMVGCVIVKDNKVVGKGWHKYFGGKHAEVNALEEALEDARGADLYVTLEPCDRYGKRPPCRVEIIKAGIKRVFFSLADKKVKRTKRVFEKKGIEVFEGLLKKEAKVLVREYVKFLRSKPQVTIKAAMTLDGKIATSKYDSKWITEGKAREIVHKMRSCYDAVVVGGNTAFKDNPFLSSHGKGERNPVRVVIDSKLRLPKRYHLLDRRGCTIVIYDTNVQKIPNHLLNKENIILAQVDIKAAKKDFNIIVKKLNSLSIKRILIEGGSEIIASALFSKSVDDIYLFVAPKIIGGREAIPLVGGRGVDKIDKALKVRRLKIREIGTDLLIRGRMR